MCEESAGNIDLLIADALMKDMSGMDLHMCVSKAGNSTRVIFITAHPLEELKSMGIEPSKQRVLRKPFTAEELLHAVFEIATDRGEKDSE